MSDGLIPQRYAKALYKYALQNNKTKEVYEEMKVVITGFQQNPSLQSVLANPFVSKADKERLLLAAAGNLKEADYEAFVKLVINHNREEYMWTIALDYREIYRDANKISQVEIITATKLDDEQMSNIKKLVERSFPGRTLEFSSSIDPDLIGGFVIVVDNVKMDASVNNELQQLRHKLIRSN